MRSSSPNTRTPMSGRTIRRSATPRCCGGSAAASRTRPPSCTCGTPSGFAALAAAQASPDLKQRVDPDDIVQSVFRTFFRRAAAGQYDVPAGDELWKLFLVIGLNKVRAVAAYHKAAKRDVRQTAAGGDYDKAARRRPRARRRGPARPADDGRRAARPAAGRRTGRSSSCGWPATRWPRSPPGPAGPSGRSSASCRNSGGRSTG